MLYELEKICGAAPEEESVGYYKGDHKPEYFQYKDEGCRRAPSCLECPFSRCIYDRRRGKCSLNKDARDARMRYFYRKGKSITELMERFDVSRRTVCRAIKEEKNRGDD